MIFIRAPANLTWTQSRVHWGLATPLLTFQKWIHAHKINPHEFNSEINPHQTNFLRGQLQKSNMRVSEGVTSNTNW